MNERDRPVSHRLTHRLTTETPAAVDRRRFMSGVLRGVALSALGALSFVLGRRARGSGHVCLRDGVCSGCGRLPSCGLPAALSRRRVEEGV